MTEPQPWPEYGMATDHEWKIGERYRSRDGQLWKVTRLTTLAIGTLPFVRMIGFRGENERDETE